MEKLVRFHNIGYLFDQDEKYADEYVSGCVDDEKSYDQAYSEQVEYLKSIETIEVQIPVEELYLENGDVDKETLDAYITDESGEYISFFSYTIVGDDRHQNVKFSWICLED